MSDLDKLEKKYEKGNKAKDIRDLAKTLEGSERLPLVSTHLQANEPNVAALTPHKTRSAKPLLVSKASGLALMMKARLA